jgi:hypothetical protein
MDLEWNWKGFQKSICYYFSHHRHSRDCTVVDEVEANQLNGNGLQGLFRSLTSGQFFQQLSSSSSSLESRI